MSSIFTTLDDVASAAGVSRAQVSRALRGGPGVRPETRDRIVAVASRLGYQPNLAARSLASASSSIIGLVIGDPDNPFHIQLARAVDRELVRTGLDPVTYLHSVQGGSAALETDRLLRLRAAGVIMLATPYSANTIGEIADRLPCVYIGSKRIAHPRVTEIAVDDERGVRMAMNHLIGLGHRRIAHLGGGLEASARQRTKAYCDVMNEAGLMPIVVSGEHTSDSGRKGVDVLFSRPHPPTAIFASNDCLALGALDSLKGRGLSVPQDVSVVGFDDIPSAANELFALSTIRQDVTCQARAAVASINLLIAGENKHKNRLTMSVEMILRKSTAAPNGADQPLIIFRDGA